MQIGTSHCSCLEHCFSCSLVSATVVKSEKTVPCKHTKDYQNLVSGIGRVGRRIKGPLLFMKLQQPKETNARMSDTMFLRCKFCFGGFGAWSVGFSPYNRPAATMHCQYHPSL